MNIDDRLREEWEYEEKRKRKRYKKILEVLSTSERLYFKTSRTLKLNRPNYNKLKKFYDSITNDLSIIYHPCINKTPSEHKVIQFIQDKTNLKFYKSMWIGNRNIDLFCPAVGSLYPIKRKGKKISKVLRTRGIAIEVNGQVHNREFKMKKDDNRDEFLKKISIGVYVIENEDIYSNHVQDKLEKLNQMSRLDHRARQRILRKIYVVTIAFHASNEILGELYGSELFNYLESNTCHEK
jgi:uncharacterized HAD superfamily protein